MHPMISQLGVECRPAFLRKKEPRAVELRPLASTRDRLRQPVRPLDVEINIIGSPDDQRGGLQRSQSLLHRDGMRAIEGRKKALQITRALSACDMRLQIDLDR